MQLAVVWILCFFIISPASSSISLSSDKWIPDKWRLEDDAVLHGGRKVDAIVATDEKMINDIEERITFLRKTEDNLKADLEKRLNVINNDDEDEEDATREGSGSKTVYVMK